MSKAYDVLQIPKYISFHMSPSINLYPPMSCHDVDVCIWSQREEEKRGEEEKKGSLNQISKPTCLILHSLHSLVWRHQKQVIRLQQRESHSRETYASTHTFHSTYHNLTLWWERGWWFSNVRSCCTKVAMRMEQASTERELFAGTPKIPFLVRLKLP